MGKTYRGQRKYEDEDRGSVKNKHSKHSNNRVRGGMKIINDYALEDNYDDDYFDEKVQVTDEISLNKISDNSR